MMNIENKKLFKMLDLKKLRMVNRPIEKAHGLPNECYVDENYFSIEKKKIFENKWIVIGVGSSVPNIGDIKPFDLLGVPLIILRDRNQNIKVYHNVCSHRGYKIVQKEEKIKNLIRCPYHSWSYDFNGKLIATPHIGGMNKHNCNKFDKSKSNLKEIRSKVWLDLIFVNLNNNELDFNTYIKPLSDRWEKFWPKNDRKLIVFSQDYGHFNLNAKTNWKFAIENYCESYHLPWVHPGLNSYSKIKDHYHIKGLPNRFAGQGTIVYNPKFKGKLNLPSFPNWPKNKKQVAEYVALFPNVMLGIHKDHFYAYWLEPISNNTTIEHMEIYYVGEEAANSAKYKSLREQNFKLWKGVQKEDLNIIEGMQMGRKSPSYNGGNFSPVMDNATHHFHKWVANNLLK